MSTPPSVCTTPSGSFSNNQPKLAAATASRKMTSEENVAGRVAFLEDYGMGIASRLVAGCDVWVNLPRAPLEASGTSGMKAAANGALNLSVADGWWDEAYDGDNGWCIPATQRPDDPAAADAADAAELYRLLEEEVVPLFYERDEDGLPRGWVRRMRASLRSIGPSFCATRMLADYEKHVYGDVVAAAPAGVQPAVASTRSQRGRA